MNIKLLSCRSSSFTSLFEMLGRNILDLILVVVYRLSGLIIFLINFFFDSIIIKKEIFHLFFFLYRFVYRSVQNCLLYLPLPLPLPFSLINKFNSQNELKHVLSTFLAVLYTLSIRNVVFSLLLSILLAKYLL